MCLHASQVIYARGTVLVSVKLFLWRIINGPYECVKVLAGLTGRSLQNRRPDFGVNRGIPILTDSRTVDWRLLVGYEIGVVLRWIENSVLKP